MGRGRMERSQLNWGAASKWHSVLFPEDKTQSGTFSATQSLNQNPGPLDHEHPKLPDL